MIALFLLLTLLLILSLFRTALVGREAPDASTSGSTFDVVSHDAELFHTIARTITDDLGLSASGAVLEAGDAATFERARPRARASDGSEPLDIVGMAVADRVLVWSDKISTMRVAQRVFPYAHELAHVAQGRLHHGSQWPTWLTEGHASWVAYHAVERLGYGTYARCRAREQRRMRKARRAKVHIPALSDLETSDRWGVSAAGRHGGVATYVQAFLAVDRLVERCSAAKLVEFLQRCGDSENPRSGEADDGTIGLAAQRIWTTVFPIAYRDFVAEFDADRSVSR